MGEAIADNSLAALVAAAAVVAVLLALVGFYVRRNRRDLKELEAELAASARAENERRPAHSPPRPPADD